jgi:hypothetical protein
MLESVSLLPVIVIMVTLAAEAMLRLVPLIQL